MPFDSVIERLTLRRTDPVTGERFVSGSRRLAGWLTDARWDGSRADTGGYWKETLERGGLIRLATLCGVCQPFLPGRVTRKLMTQVL